MKYTSYQQKLNDSLDKLWKKFQQILNDKDYSDLEALLLAGKLFRHVISISVEYDEKEKKLFEKIFGGLLTNLTYFVEEIWVLAKKKEEEHHDEPRN